MRSPAVSPGSSSYHVSLGLAESEASRRASSCGRKGLGARGVGHGGQLPAGSVGTVPAGGSVSGSSSLRAAKSALARSVSHFTASPALVG